MPTVEDQALAARFYLDIFQRGNLAAADEILAPTFVIHSPDFELPPGPESVKYWAALTRVTFPDLQLTQVHSSTVGDKVVIHWTACATQQQELLSDASSGEPVTATGSTIFRLADGKLVELWPV